jgi:methylglutaconyl-CoA hydratase
MISGHVTLGRDDRGVATLTLDRPAKRNALTEAMAADIMQALGQLRRDPALRVLVLTARGEIFCAGGDLQWFLQSLDDTREGRIARSAVMAGLTDALDTFPRPVIGRITGDALGAGAGLVAACDVALGLETARLAFSETRIGLIPASFLTHVLRRIGPARARAIMLSGAPVSGTKAAAIGLLDEACATPAALDARTDAVIEEMLLAAPESAGATKAMIARVAACPPDEAAAHIRQCIGDMWEQEEPRKRLARFRKTP